MLLSSFLHFRLASLKLQVMLRKSHTVFLDPGKLNKTVWSFRNICVHQDKM